MGAPATVGLRTRSLGITGSVSAPSSSSVVASPCKMSLVRHPSLAETKTCDIFVESRLCEADCEAKFMPILRSGALANIGLRSCMEDVYVCIDNFMNDFGVKNFADEPNAFYGLQIVHCIERATMSYLSCSYCQCRSIERVISCSCFKSWRLYS